MAHNVCETTAEGAECRIGAALRPAVVHGFYFITCERCFLHVDDLYRQTVQSCSKPIYAVLVLFRTAHTPTHILNLT